MVTAVMTLSLARGSDITRYHGPVVPLIRFDLERLDFSYRPLRKHGQSPHSFLFLSRAKSLGVVLGSGLGSTITVVTVWAGSGRRSGSGRKFRGMSTGNAIRLPFGSAKMAVRRSP